MKRQNIFIKIWNLLKRVLEKIIRIVFSWNPTLNTLYKAKEILYKSRQTNLKILGLVLLTLYNILYTFDKMFIIVKSTITKRVY